MQKIKLFLVVASFLGLSACVENSAIEVPFEVTVKRRWDNGNPSLSLEYYDPGKLSDFLKKDYNKHGVLLVQESFRDYVLDGKTVHFFNNGDTLQSLDYVNGRISGKVKVWYNSGELKSVATYHRDTLQVMNQYYKNGQLISVVPMVKGQLHGEAVYYDSLGNVEITGAWENNQRQGEWKHFDQNGKLNAIEVYQNDQIVSSRDVD